MDGWTYLTRNSREGFVSPTLRRCAKDGAPSFVVGIERGIRRVGHSPDVHKQNISNSLESLNRTDRIVEQLRES